MLSKASKMGIFSKTVRVAIPVQAEQDSGVKANSIPG